MLDNQLPVEPITDDPVRHPFAVLDRIELEVGFHEVPVALVPGPGTWQEGWLHCLPRLGVHVHAARLIAVSGVAIRVAVAPRRATILRDRREIPSDLRLIDVSPILHGENRDAAVLIVLLNVRRQVGERGPGVGSILVGQEHELVRVIGTARADPVTAVLHPIAQVYGFRSQEGAPRRSTPGGGRRPDGKVDLESARAADDVLRCGDGQRRIVVPAPRREARVLEGLL